MKVFSRVTHGVNPVCFRQQASRVSRQGTLRPVRCTNLATNFPPWPALPFHDRQIRAPWTVQRCLSAAIRTLRQSKLPIGCCPAAEGRQLVLSALGKVGEDVGVVLPAIRKDAVTGNQAAAITALVAHRVKGLPLQYLTGSAGFWLSQLRTHPDVLIPRSDSETLVDLCIQALHQSFSLSRTDESTKAVADLGCGSGAIGIAVLTELNRNQKQSVRCVSIDTNPIAVRLTRQNAAQEGLQEALLALRCSATELACDPFWQNSFDAVVANPPYIEAHDHVMQQVRIHEPKSALYGDMSVLIAFIGSALRLLRPGGRAFIETGRSQAMRLERLFKESSHNVGEAPSVAFRGASCVKVFEDWGGPRGVRVVRSHS